MSPRTGPRSAAPGWDHAARALTHPVVMLALAIWAANDHLGKALWPGVVTGKLSDVASLVAFPVVALAVWGAVVAAAGIPAPSPRASNAALAVAALATAAVMASINTLDVAADAYRWGLGAAQWPFHAALAAVRGGPVPALRPVALWMDPADLWTLPAVLVAVWAGWHRGAPPRSTAAAPRRCRRLRP